MNLNLIMQLMKSKNPNAMVQNLIKSNPQVAQAVPITKQIMTSGGTQREQLQMACKQSNTDEKQVEEQLKKLGINL